MEALRTAGAHIVLLSDVGGGCPDLAVMHRGKTYWLEVKSSAADACRKGKTADRQREFKETAQAHGVEVHTVWDPEMALVAIGVMEGL